MMRYSRGEQGATLIVLGAALIGMAAGCQRQKQSDSGKTYTADQKQAQGGGAGKPVDAGGQSEAKPLDAPADTTNGKSSQKSDAGTSDATKGQAVAEPGAPVEHDAQPPKPGRSGGHS